MPQTNTSLSRRSDRHKPDRMAYTRCDPLKTFYRSTDYFHLLRTRNPILIRRIVRMMIDFAHLTMRRLDKSPKLKTKRFVFNYFIQITPKWGMKLLSHKTNKLIVLHSTKVMRDFSGGFKSGTFIFMFDLSTEHQQLTFHLKELEEILLKGLFNATGNTIRLWRSKINTPLN